MFSGFAGVTQLVECQPSKLNVVDTSSDQSIISVGTSATPSSTPSNPSAKPTKDDNLQRLIEAWPKLPEAIKAGIVAMVEAAKG